MNWNKQVYMTLDELYRLLSMGYRAKPSKRVKNKSSFQTGVFQATQAIIQEMQEKYGD